VVAADETAEVLQALERIAADELYASPTVARGLLLQMLANGSVDTRREAYGQLKRREITGLSLIGRAVLARPGRDRTAVEREDNRDAPSAN
jgi:hypothetical protein